MTPPQETALAPDRVDLPAEPVAVRRGPIPAVVPPTSAAKHRGEQIALFSFVVIPFLAVVAAIPILLAAVGANVQVGPEMRHINNADGLLIRSNVEGNYFRMQIKGRDVSRLRTTRKYWYTADSVRFQFFDGEESSPSRP